MEIVVALIPRQLSKGSPHILSYMPEMLADSLNKELSTRRQQVQSNKALRL